MNVSIEQSQDWPKIISPSNDKIFIPLAFCRSLFKYKLIEQPHQKENQCDRNKYQIKIKSMGLYSYLFIFLLSTQPRTLLVGFLHFPLASCVSYLLFASIAVSSYEKRHHHNISPIRFYALPLRLNEQ